METLSQIKCAFPGKVAPDFLRVVLVTMVAHYADVIKVAIRHKQYYVSFCFEYKAFISSSY